MSIDRIYGFIAQEKDLILYDNLAIIDLSFPFVFDDDNSTAYTFPGYSSGYLKIYDERLGFLIKSFSSQVTRNSNYLVLNASASDMSFNDVGDYQYELGYVRSGGYSIPLRYGKLTIV